MLELSQVDSHYGASQALYNVNLSAEPGKISCVLGRNGVGKTTLLKALAGQQNISAGSIMFNGKDISKMSAAQRAKQGIAIVPQGREIFGQLTVLENLKTGFSVLPKSERFIPDEIFRLFPVLKQMLARRGGDLSGGQQQQLAIARALIMRPKLLMLDEPTEGIQPSIIKDIQKVLALLRDRGEMAIVLVEQYFDFAVALADHYTVLDRGNVVLQGSKDEVDEADVKRWMSV
ncbi:urea ABC transporter ATP-binding subunit UrtE [Agarivorans sp. TSD2052]|uniref:urea ABC transporter ATP-binding subunit UrtE n=1 Tax=Agarivorans sp. TSD2052 TaxID=2937286 RepID=UPI00200CE340|nr:urea ABC transporter ATP-binding subunit UrtE [Agarivorans sp. TSD2052]UPW18433.1 urea ABC transporter ATP-binding subunit UrtE [Agarivorans sp. TSD2052]